jgi:hypothetical protein
VTADTKLGGMELAHQILQLITLLGFAAACGGILAQVRVRDPEVNEAMLAGGWVQLVGWVALSAWQMIGLPPYPGPSGQYLQPAVVAVIMVLQLILLASNRKFTTIPRGLWGILLIMSLAESALVIIWQ